MNSRVLLIGGTGVFGKRLARHLTSFEDIDLIVTSRSEHKAKALASKLGGNCGGIGLDTGHDLQGALTKTKPWAVVDCSGPFQGQGYQTAHTVLSSGAHMIDLADARDYLLGYVDALDDLAKQKGVVGLAGASSTPALSGTVVAALTEGWQQVETIDICITPGGKSDVGNAVIAAIMSYIGRDIRTWRDGELNWTKGWLGSRIIHVPGLGKRRVAPVETADAELLSARYPEVRRVSFSAGLESPIEQWGLQFISRLRSINLFPNPKYFIPLLLAARKITRIPTSDRGGMVVDVAGRNADGEQQRVRWSLLAKNNQGPQVPSLAAAASIRALLAGQLTPGARLANIDLSLQQVEAEMTPYAISTTHEILPNV